MRFEIFVQMRRLKEGSVVRVYIDGTDWIGLIVPNPWKGTYNAVWIAGDKRGLRRTAVNQHTVKYIRLYDP